MSGPRAGLRRLDMSPQDGAEAQGTQVRQTPRRLDPSLTMLVHMPRAPGVKICRRGGDNGAPHAFPTFPSIPQSCTPLTFAARCARRCFVFLLSGAGAEGGLGVGFVSDALDGEGQGRDQGGSASAAPEAGRSEGADHSGVVGGAGFALPTKNG